MFQYKKKDGSLQVERTQVMHIEIDVESSWHFNYISFITISMMRFSKFLWKMIRARGCLKITMPDLLEIYHFNFVESRFLRGAFNDDGWAIGKNANSKKLPSNIAKNWRLPSFGNIKVWPELKWFCMNER